MSEMTISPATHRGVHTMVIGRPKAGYRGTTDVSASVHPRDRNPTSDLYLMKKADFVQQIVSHIDAQIKALGQAPEPELQEEMYQSCHDLIVRKVTVQT